MPNIEELIFLMKGGVITPEDAIGTYESQEAARKENRIKRQAAMEKSQQSSLDKLGTLAASEAKQGTTLEDLARLASAKVGQPLTPEQLYSAPGISDLYLPMGQTGFVGNAGQSRINPTLDPEDAGDIAVLKRKGNTLDQIAQKFGQIYGSKTLERLMPEIQKVYSSAGF